MSKTNPTSKMPTFDRKLAESKLLDHITEKGVFDKPALYRQDISVQEYKFGEPFPGLVYEAKKHETVSGDIIGIHAIINTTRDGYIVAFNGEKLQVGGYDGMGNLQCIGRLPSGFVEVKDLADL